MPVIAAPYDDLVALIGRKVPRDELVARIPMMGGAWEGEDEKHRLQFEFFPNRPDLLSIEGLARACRAYFDVKPGLATYDVHPSDEVVTVDAAVAAIRPVIGFARVTGLKLDDDRLAALIELQERLTIGPGRKRKKVAIGIHDAARVHAPFRYTAVGLDEHPFVPLAMKEPLTPRQIFERHEKGKLYGPLLAGQKKVPLIVDRDDEVLSLPPVINGQLTALSTSTRDVLVDVTGIDERAVMGILNIVVCALAERGGTIHSLTIEQGKKRRRTPDLTPLVTRLPYARIKALLGLDVDHNTTKRLLARLGHDAQEDGPDAAQVYSPAYRLDLIHPDDLVEDVGIGHGFDRFQGRLPERALFGGVLPETRRLRKARQSLLGLGFTEVVTLTVASRREAFHLMHSSSVPVVEMANPLTAEQSILRPRLVPGLLGILRTNKQRELPQAIFEVGHVVPTPDDGAHTQLRVAALRISAGANLSECKGYVQSVLRDLGIGATIEPGEPAGYLHGRAGVLRGATGEVGWFGELRPDVITDFELGAPVIGFEIILHGP